MVFLLSNPVDRIQSKAQPQKTAPYQFSIVIQKLVENHLSQAHLNDRLQDLPQQFINPKPRKWALIDYRAINTNQIIGIEPELFLAILQGAIDTEAPIQDYTYTSRQYLEMVSEPMAKFVGGTLDNQGNLQTLGLWELEERRHTPALLKIHQQLGGTKIQPNYRQPSPYCPSDSAPQDLYRHGLHRIATEYGATCLYLWLMGHATGPLQQALAELCIDEVNHLTKFLGFGTWLYPQNWLWENQRHHQKSAHRKPHGNLLQTYQRMMSVLHWPEWQWQHRGELIYTFYLVMSMLWTWHRNLKYEDLDRLFGQSPLRTY